MAKIDRPRGLIRYASLNSIERGKPFRWTPRMSGYAAVLSVLIGLFLFLVLTRSNVEATLLRAPGAMFQQLPNGNLINLYTLQLVNKTSRPIPVWLKLENVPGKLSIMGNPNRSCRGTTGRDLHLDRARAGFAAEWPEKFDVGVYSQGAGSKLFTLLLLGRVTELVPLPSMKLFPKTRNPWPIGLVLVFHRVHRLHRRFCHICQPPENGPGPRRLL
jgi:hypothetical protein